MSLVEKELEHYRSMVEMALRSRAERPSDTLYVDNRLRAIIQGYTALLAELDQWFSRNPHQLPAGYGADLRPEIRKEISNYQLLLTRLQQGQ